MSEITTSHGADVDTDVVLRDGSTVCLRRVRPDDRAAVQAFFETLSPESRYYRFLAATNVTATMVTATVDVDFDRSYTVLAERGRGIVGVATWIRDITAPQRAALAFAQILHLGNARSAEPVLRPSRVTAMVSELLTVRFVMVYGSL